jgi:hypothetical protein
MINNSGLAIKWYVSNAQNWNLSSCQ